MRNYLDQINRAVDYIEDHLHKEIDISILAKKAGMSKWHFQRVFRAMVGDTVKEYVEKRKLSRAAMELICTDHKILDIALAYGFDSHEVFIRAFKRVFETTPSKFREDNYGLSQIPQKPAITLDYLKHLYKGITMEPTIKFIQETRVIGLAEKIHTVHDAEFPSNLARIPALWQRFHQRKSEINSAELGAAVGIIDQISSNQQEESLEYVAGIMVNGESDAPDDFVWRKIPEGEYAEFVHKGSVRQIAHTMNYIYGSWLPKSGRTRRDGPEFSIRDENFDPQSDDGEIRIYIPLQ